MMARTSNNLDDDTMKTSRHMKTSKHMKNSIPNHLLTLVSTLIDGPGVSNDSFHSLH